MMRTPPNFVPGRPAQEGGNAAKSAIGTLLKDAERGPTRVGAPRSCFRRAKEKPRLQAGAATGGARRIVQFGHATLSKFLDYRTSLVRGAERRVGVSWLARRIFATRACPKHIGSLAEAHC